MKTLIIGILTIFSFNNFACIGGAPLKGDFLNLARHLAFPEDSLSVADPSPKPSNMTCANFDELEDRLGLFKDCLRSSSYQGLFHCLRLKTIRAFEPNNSLARRTTVNFDDPYGGCRPRDRVAYAILGRSPIYFCVEKHPEFVSRVLNGPIQLSVQEVQSPEGRRIERFLTVAMVAENYIHELMHVVGLNHGSRMWDLMNRNFEVLKLKPVMTVSDPSSISSEAVGCMRGAYAAQTAIEEPIDSP